MMTTFPSTRDVLSEELAHDLFQLVFAYQLMADQPLSDTRVDDAQRDHLLECALRSYASLLRETHRDREATMVLEQAQALSTPSYGPTVKLLSA